MASSSSIDTPLVVEVKDRTPLVLKRHPYKSMEDDPVGTFSFIPHRVLQVDNVRAYIHCEIEETDTKDIWICILTVSWMKLVTLSCNLCNYKGRVSSSL